MAPRTTVPGRAARSRRRLSVPVRRPGIYLGVAAAGAVLVNVLAGTEPAAQAGAEPAGSVSVAAQLGLTAESGAVEAPQNLQPLADLAASRSSREAAQVAAQQVQAAAGQAELDRRKAEAEAAARAAAEAAAAEATATATAEAAAGSAAAAPRADEPVPTAAAARAGIAHISNTAGSVKPVVQAAANQVVGNVPGAAGITLGGTRPSATDPGGHPSGLALDYMVLSNTALGNAIVQYHVAHWQELGVEYLIYRQRMLSSPGGSWTPMEDRGSPTANHMDHVHVNYRG
jgi:hypothetical protein